MIPSPSETRASLIVRLRDAADVAAWDEVLNWLEVFSARRADTPFAGGDNYRLWIQNKHKSPKG